MTGFFLPHVQQIRPARDAQAPWSAVKKKSLPVNARLRAVVYVMEKTDGPLRKLGRTTNLKQRVLGVQRKAGVTMAVSFWAEFCQADAVKVEALAIRLAHGCSPAIAGKEWFHANTRMLSEAVLLASKHLGIRHISQAGIPDSVDHYTSDEAIMIEEDNNQHCVHYQYGPMVWERS